MSTPWHDHYGYYNQEEGGAGGLTEAEVQALIAAEALDEESHDELDHSEVPGLPSTDGVATVYVYDGSDYLLSGGRIFVGSVDPDTEGFTITDGDQWEDTSV